MLLPRHQIRLVFLTMTGLAALLFVSRIAAQESPTRPSVDFDSQIRPLLSDRCYTCHGPDEAALEAGLRLDLGVGLDQRLAESSGRVILSPGNPTDSELYLRVIATDHEQMPPPESGLQLSAGEVALLKQWIEEGANWDRHWSFQPLPKDVVVPEVADPSSWVQNPIDAFILQGMQDKGLQPTAPASDHQLLRRLYLDVIGLPPTQAEVAQWNAIAKPERWEQVVDHLLARPEYGQRMASDWLDVARYSDTYGYQVDRERFVWPWRDWVVRAFNENMPFDKFGTLQLAGDLLPNATFAEILPTTFGRLHPQEVEGGSIEEEFRMKYVSDRTETYAMAFLGLTFECSRCHNHKYDPISQTEYYRLTAFFENIDEAGLYSYFTDSVPTPTAVLPNEHVEQELLRLQQQIAAQEQSLQARRDQCEDLRPWLQQTEKHSEGAAASLQAAVPDTWPGQIAHLSYAADAKLPEKSENRLVPFQPQGSGSDRQAIELSGDEAVKLEVGNFRRWQPFSFSLWMWVPQPMERAVILHRSGAWTDAGSRGYELLLENERLKFSLIHFWPGNAVSIRAIDTTPVAQWLHVTVTYDGSSRADGLSIFVDGKRVQTEVVRDKLTKQITGGGGDQIALGERFRDQGFKGGRVAEVRVFSRQLSALEAMVLAQVDATPAALHEYRRVAWERAAIESAPELAVDWALQHDADYQAELTQLEKLREQWGNLQDQRQEIMVMQELPIRKPSFFRERGDYDAPKFEVAPGVPEAILPWSDDLPNDRAGLAAWTFDRRNPLTARVAVNRWWQMLFGEGLVRTPEDFGNQGQRPTHPALLDYLAIRLIDSGWDVKQTLRAMLLSATYQQAVVAEASVVEADPENRCWTRAGSHRWPAETLRDQALAVAGLLDAKPDGPPVKPYDLAEAFAPLPTDGGPLVYRRSLYTYWKRMSPSPVMIALDAVKRDVCQVKRERTTTPAQSLVFLNAPQFVEASRALAVRVWRDQPDAIETSLSDMVQQMLARTPTAQELETLSKLYHEQLQRFEQSPERLEAYLSIGHYRIPAELPPAPLGALAVVANTLMGLDQWTTRR